MMDEPTAVWNRIPFEEKRLIWILGLQYHSAGYKDPETLREYEALRKERIDRERAERYEVE